MSMGPVAIFDKSFLQMISVDEAVWFGNFYRANITPLFFAETLADLEKEIAKGRTPEQVVGNLARKDTRSGCVPVYLNELSPAEARGTFPGFVYQLGNLLASVNATLQVSYAASHDNDYSTALAIVASASALAVSLLVGFGVEHKGIHLGTGSNAEPVLAHAGGKDAFAVQGK